MSKTPIIVMLVHGFPVDHRMWDACIEKLESQAEASHIPLRVIACDTPGSGTHGLQALEDWSKCALDEDQALSWVADQYISDMHEAGYEKAIWVGLSMGGYIVLDIVKRYRSAVEGVALLDTKAEQDSPEAQKRRYDIADTCLREHTVEPVMGFIHQGKYCSNDEQKRIEALFTQWIQDQPPEGIAFRQRMAAARSSYEDVLAGITVPALILCGDHDPSSPPEAMGKLAKQIPGTTRFEVVERCGHFSAVEHPREVAEAIMKLVQDVASC